MANGLWTLPLVSTRAEFLLYVKKTPTCWLWIGSLTGPGQYGQLRWKGKRCYAHRKSWELFKGPIPKGKHILHGPYCDVKYCVRPYHLYAGTRNDNARDFIQRLSHHHNKAVLTPQDVKRIRQIARDQGVPPPMNHGMNNRHGRKQAIMKIADQYPLIGYKAIKRVIDRVSWFHIP